MTKRGAVLGSFGAGVVALAFRDLLINGVPAGDPRYGFNETRAKKSGAARAAEREARERQHREALYTQKGKTHEQ